MEAHERRGAVGEGREEERALERIVSVLKRHGPELEERYKVGSLGVFGSFVRGEQKEGSDLDLLVEFSETPNLFEFMDLEEHLSELLGVEVELVSRAALKGNIGRNILREVVPVT